MSERPEGARRAATIADVARDAGVSVRTVSRVLNKSPKVGAHTQRTIERVIADLDFRPSLSARGLAARRSFLLGVVQGDHNAHVVSVLQRGIVEVCSQAGYELLVHPVSLDDARLEANLLDFARRTQVDGLVLLPPVSEVASLGRVLAQQGVRAVGIAAVRVPSHPAMLVMEERAAAAAMAEHLLALGHRKIAMITGPLHFHSATEREQGFRTALERAGVAVPRAFVREGDYGFDRGLVAAGELLELADRPTAIFAANDITALAALKAARDHGLSVPGQISIAGFDDSDVAAMISPALTTIRRPLHAIATEATRRLIALAQGGAERLPDHHVELTLVARQSTGPLPDR